jgi:hypothetical protein
MAAIANQMMDINSQHHNLLGNQMLPKSEDFCILMAILFVIILPHIFVRSISRKCLDQTL